MPVTNETIDAIYNTSEELRRNASKLQGVYSPLVSDNANEVASILQHLKTASDGLVDLIERAYQQFESPD